MLSLSVVVIDDDASQRNILSGFLVKAGCSVISCENGTQCIDKVRKQYVDVVITDFRMPGMDGLEVLKKVKDINPEIQVILMTAYGTVEDAVEAMKNGAWDYLSKPVDLDELELKLKKVADHNSLIKENQLLKSQIKSESIITNFIYKSKSIEEVLNLVARVSDSNTSILIQGESGTGKEMIAKAIHQASPRKDKPFVAVNCAAIPETLFESELFGHEKGAFTGAHQRAKGRFEIAEGGTIFLDEVADIPLQFQVKLLRVIQEREFQRLGSSQIIKSDIRILSATNKNMQKLVEEETFRADLFFRLNVIPITIPPLRDRREDIPELVKYFIEKHSRINRRDVSAISTEGLDVLLKYDYPGNVRELENIIERAVILARNQVITRDDLPIFSAVSLSPTFGESMPAQVEHLEKILISEAMQNAHGVQTKAAELLGISERVLRYKLGKYEIN